MSKCSCLVEKNHTLQFHCSMIFSENNCILCTFPGYGEMGFGETGFGETGFGESGFSESGRHH